MAAPAGSGSETVAPRRQRAGEGQGGRRIDTAGDGAGRGSRRSQILQHTKKVRNTGVDFDKSADPPPDPKTLSVLGLGDYANHIFGESESESESESIKQARKRLNEEYLAPLSFANDLLVARIGVSRAQEDGLRLR